MNYMTLIADSGSTKTNWCFLDDRLERSYFDTDGFNPYFVDTPHIIEAVTRHLPSHIDPAAVRKIYFYGAGCFDDQASVVGDALKHCFAGAEIAVALDLLASARALLGDNPGFAAILGTGSNTCLYSGKEIIANIDSLGYILGDEGSGSYIGKKLLGDYIRGYMPAPVQQEFYEQYRLSREEIIERVYTQPMANRFCAGFTQFIPGCTTDPAYVYGIVRSAFKDFFENLVTHYPGYFNYTFNCVGSIACTYRTILEDTAAAYGMVTGKIIQRPIEELAGYHER